MGAMTNRLQIIDRITNRSPRPVSRVDHMRTRASTHSHYQPAHATAPDRIRQAKITNVG